MFKRIKTVILFLILLAITGIDAQPYVIMISFDGFRWDYLNRGITPALQSVMDEGVHASSLRPSFPSKTFPNHYSIITGMYTENHGIIANYFRNPKTGEIYSIADTNSKWDSKWYNGEPFWETAGKNGIKTASIFWPASELRGDKNQPDYFKFYDRDMPYNDRIDTLISWLLKPAELRPRFLSLYFSATDTYGHKYGPNSPEVNNAIKQLDKASGYLLQRLDNSGLADSVDLIFVSDHGMTEVSPDRIVNPEKFLSGFDYTLQDSGPVMRIDAPANQIDSIYHRLKLNAQHYRVYKKNDMPSFYHYSNSYLISPIVVIADIGWSLVDNDGFIKAGRYFSKGNHGYEKDHLDMHGIFIAGGPSFKQGYKTGTLWNVDIYPLLSDIFGIEPNPGIDGKLERIEFILKGK